MYIIHCIFKTFVRRDGKARPFNRACYHSQRADTDIADTDILEAVAYVTDDIHDTSADVTNGIADKADAPNAVSDCRDAVANLTYTIDDNAEADIPDAVNYVTDDIRRRADNVKR